MRLKALTGVVFVFALAAIGVSSLAVATTPSRATQSATPLPQTVAPPGDPGAGRRKAESERCVECHGVEGQGVAHLVTADMAPGSITPSLAKLAGQRPAYLVKQLLNFQSGARKNDVMLVMAQHLDDADRRDLAAYFSLLAPMRSPPASRSDTDRGRTLYESGDSSRRIVACIACHGAEGDAPTTPDPQVPRLAGQDPIYLEQQLTDWRSGWRHNSTNGVMNQVAKALTDTEIRALAGYLAGQSANVAMP